MKFKRQRGDTLVFFNNDLIGVIDKHYSNNGTQTFYAFDSLDSRFNFAHLWESEKLNNLKARLRRAAIR